MGTPPKATASLSFLAANLLLRTESEFSTMHKRALTWMLTDFLSPHTYTSWDRLSKGLSPCELPSQSLSLLAPPCCPHELLFLLFSSRSCRGSSQSYSSVHITPSLVLSWLSFYSPLSLHLLSLSSILYSKWFGKMSMVVLDSPYFHYAFKTQG